MITAMLRCMAGMVIVSALLTGCRQPPIPDVRIRQNGLGPMRVAVAPALNFSGSADVDPNAAADIMAGELSHVEGFEVLPVSRVLAVLAEQGFTHVDSPARALWIKDRLGADALLVFGLTEYEAYEPPVVGIAAQLYGRRVGAPVRVSPPVSGVDLASASVVVAASVSQRPLESADGLLAQTSRVFNAAHEPTRREVKAYAQIRGGPNSVFGWRKYLVSQRHYLRFCCHATIKRMVQQGNRITDVTGP